jgi:hypothetical protein
MSQKDVQPTPDDVICQCGGTCEACKLRELLALQGDGRHPRRQRRSASIDWNRLRRAGKEKK